MKKKIICTILVTVLAVTVYTGCGEKQDTKAGDAISFDTETKDSDLTTEIQAQVTLDTLLPTSSPKPVVAESVTSSSATAPTKVPEGTVTEAPKETPDPTATPKALVTPTPVPSTETETVTVANISNNKGTTTEAPKEPSDPTPKETPAPTPKATAIPEATPVPTPAPCNHNFVKQYWPSAPTCNAGGYYMYVCSICGETGSDGTDPALPHTPETVIEVDAKYCDEHGIKVTYCTSCGNELGREGFDGTEHEWVTGTSDPVWDWDKQDFVTKEVTYCSRCHAQR